MCPGQPVAAACGHRQWDWTFPHGSRKQQTYVCTTEHYSSYAHSLRVYRPTGRTHMLKMRMYFFTPRRLQRISSTLNEKIL